MMNRGARKALLGAIAAFGVLGCACVLLLADGGEKESLLLSTQLAYTYTPEVPLVGVTIPLHSPASFPPEVGRGNLQRELNRVQRQDDVFEDFNGYGYST
jgi:hypothetical protein